MPSPLRPDRQHHPTTDHTIPTASPHAPIKLCPPPQMSYSAWTVTSPYLHKLYKSFKAPRLSYVLQSSISNVVLARVPFSEGTLHLFFLWNHPVYTSPDRPIKLHPRVPSQLPHDLLLAACSGIPALSLCGIAPLPSVPLPLPASGAAPSLVTEERTESGGRPSPPPLNLRVWVTPFGKVILPSLSQLDARF